METSTLRQYVGVEPGAELPVFSWPGGYAIGYVTDDGAVFCGDCANGRNGSQASEDPDDAGTGWRMVAAFSAAESDSCSYCAHCNTQIAGYCDGPDDHSEHCEHHA